ncbi:G-patch domain containing protein [Nitzschia inconspicua]|uniref:G-patch domain containing protein n=1 Tax=Nitzschia inconspicua TaxID=303405 RepID=A0A9K3L384_9STRA|nr:G-patch domain containing protein [Nitzschia inconspicua]
MATVKTASPTDAVVSSTSNIFLALAGSKHKRKLGATLNESAAVGPNDFAKRQLEKLGWKEGTGLGKKRDGRSTHIRVKQRAHESGLGSTSTDIDPVVSADQWWKSSVGNTLAKLSAKQKTKKSKKNSKKEKKKKDSSDDDTDDIQTQKTTTKVYTDEELFQATGGVRFGMRAQTQQRSKWKRAESNISQEEEEQAKQKTEWDGLSAPRVVLSTTTITTTDRSDTKRSNKRSRDTTESSFIPLQNDESKKEAAAAEEEEKSKKRKKSKSNSDDDNEKSSKKKMKKEKKSKKKKKEKNEEDQ